MTKTYYFTNRNRSSLVTIVSIDKLLDYRQRNNWMEIDREEFEFIETHWPDDPEWIARYHADGGAGGSGEGSVCNY